MTLVLIKSMYVSHNMYRFFCLRFDVFSQNKIRNKVYA